MSPQALVTLLTFVLVFIMMMIALFVIPNDNGVKGKAMLFLTYILIFVPIFFLQTYSINCMVVGDCGIWSWILTFFVVILSLFYIVLAIFGIVGAKKTKKAEETTVQINNVPTVDPTLATPSTTTTVTTTATSTTPTTATATAPATTP